MLSDFISVWQLDDKSDIYFGKHESKFVVAFNIL